MHSPARLRTSFVVVLGIVAFAAAIGCAKDASQSPGPAASFEQPADEAADIAEEATMNDAGADVVQIDVEGEPGGYTATVTVASADTGCDAYADWWEVLSADGALLYRRTLAHSHVGEQPFLRSGGPIAVDAEHEIVVRAHMSTTGYGGIALRGSVRGGFSPDRLVDDFAADVERVDPQPPPCAF